MTRSREINAISVANTAPRASIVVTHARRVAGSLRHGA